LIRNNLDSVTASNIINDINKNLNKKNYNLNINAEVNNTNNTKKNEGRGSKTIMDLAKRFENKDESHTPTNNTNKNIKTANKIDTLNIVKNNILNANTNARIEDNSNKEEDKNQIKNDADKNLTDLSVLQTGSGRVSAVLNRLNSNKIKYDENNENTNNNINFNQNNVKEITEKINTNLQSSQNTKSRDSLLLKSNFNTLERNEEINFGNQNAVFIENKEIEKISDDSMIQDFKNLLKFKRNTSDPFDMEYNLNYKGKENKERNNDKDIELYPINSKEILTFEDAEQMKYIENESDKSHELEVEDIENKIEYLDDDEEIKKINNKNNCKYDKIKNTTIKITNNQDDQNRGRNSTFKFKPKNSLSKKPLNLNIDSIENNTFESKNESKTNKDLLSKNIHSPKNNDLKIQIQNINDLESFKNVLNKKKREGPLYKNDLTRSKDSSLKNNTNNSEITESNLSSTNKTMNKANQNISPANTRFSAKEKMEYSIVDDNKSNISDNLSRSSVISLERKSVKYYKRKIENRIRMQEQDKLERESTDKKRRNTHSHRNNKKNKDIFNDNFEEMKEILAKLKLQTSENEKDFMDKNRDLLMKMGIHEKDMPSIKELTTYFESQLEPNSKTKFSELSLDDSKNDLSLLNKEKFINNESENFNIDEYNKNNNLKSELEEIKKRSTLNHAKKLYENVSLIPEEREEDSSFMFKDKERNSDNNDNKQRSSNIKSVNISLNITSNKIFVGENINLNTLINVNNRVNTEVTPVKKNINFDIMNDNEKYDFGIDCNYNKTVKNRNFPLKDKPNKNVFADRNRINADNPFTNNQNYGSIICNKINKQDCYNSEKPQNLLRMGDIDKEEMFNPEKDLVDTVTPKNAFSEINNLISKENNFAPILEESDINKKDSENGFYDTFCNKKSENNNFVVHNINNIEYEKNIETKFFDSKKLSSSNINNINIEPNKIKNFNSIGFVIDNITATPKKTNEICYIAENKKKNYLENLKVQLINNCTIDGISKITLNKNAICKDNDNLFELVSSSNNNDITKASSLNFNPILNYSVGKNINGNGKYFNNFFSTSKR